MTTTYTVRAVRWQHGWELHIDGEGVTQSRTLADADQMVRDYVASLTGRDMTTAEVVIEPDLDGIEDQVAEIRARLERAQRETREAATASREAARELRRRGLSVSDTATVLGVSRGRVSQLVKPDTQKAS